MLSVVGMALGLKCIVETNPIRVSQQAQDQLLTLTLHIITQFIILIGISILQDCLAYGMPCQLLILINHSPPLKPNSKHICGTIS